MLESAIETVGLTASLRGALACGRAALALTRECRTLAEWALDYFKRRWQPIAYASGSKAPREKDWHKVRHTPETIAVAFADGRNVGLLLGAASGGLVDADFDDPVALRCARSFLPPTDCSFGRKSKLVSHALYVCDDVPERGASLKFEDPEHGCLLELRAQSNQQTMVPPSLHPSGERLGWRRFGEPARVKYADLCRAMSWSAAATLVAYRIGPHNRHDVMLKVAGALLRSMPKDDVSRILEVAYEASGGKDWTDTRRAIDNTAQRLEGGDRVMGGGKLTELWGRDAVARLFEWLGIDKDKPSRDGAQQEKARNQGQLRARLRKSSEIVEQQVEWLWNSWLAKRKGAILEGDPGVGKSTMSMDLIARATTGAPFPGCGERREPINVIVAATEDTYEDSLLPQLRVAGADLDRVYHFEALTEDGIPVPWDAEDFGLLLREAQSVDVRFIFLDSLMSILGKIETHKDAAVRRELVRILHGAARIGAQVLGLRHMHKGDKSTSLYAGGGSIAFTALMRAVLVATRDPEAWEDGSRGVLAAIKISNARRPKSIRYRIVERESGITGIEWGDECDYTADQLVSFKPDEGRKSDERVEARLWLGPWMGDRPYVLAMEANQAAADAGHSWSPDTLRRAALDLGCRVEGHGRGARWVRNF